MADASSAILVYHWVEESCGLFPKSYFFVCCIYIQEQSFNNFDNDTMKLSVNEAKLTGL